MARTGKKRKAGENGALEAFDIIIIDQRPLRRGLASECAAALRKLEEVKVGWHQFDREDRPAFVRWRAREFGALLSEARDVEIRIRDAQALVREVENEMRRAFQSPQSAYRRVMFRRENPQSADEEPPVFQPQNTGSARRLTEFEQEALFHDWVQKFLGTNPDKMDDAAYTETFEAFKTHMFQTARPEEAKPRVERVQEPQTSQKIAEEEVEGEEETEADVRVKELYRRLVRRLHPDLRADGSAEVSALWHEVQEAYAASDVAQMELLLALSNIAVDEVGDETSVSQMQELLRELERSWRALQKRLQEAEREDGWNFARSGPNEALREHVERQLKFELATRSRHLAMLTQAIAEWAAAPVGSRF